MYDWMKDLQDLAGSVGGAAKQAADAAIGAVPVSMSDVGGALELMDVPRQFAAHEVLAPLSFGIARGAQAVGIENDESREVIDAWRRGGGEAVWEDAMVGDAPWYIKAPLDVLSDPLTYVGFGLAGKAGQGIKHGARALQNPVARKALTGIGSSLNAVQAVSNVGDKIVEGPFRLAGKGIKKAGGRLFDLAPADRVRADMDDLNLALNERRSARAAGPTPPKTYKGSSALAIPSSSAIQPYSLVTPWTNAAGREFATPYSDGKALVSVQQAADAAWQRLAARNAPGEYKPRGVRGWLGKVTQGPASTTLGIVPPEVPTSTVPRFNDEDFNDLAEIGVKLMVDWDMDNTATPWLALNRASEGMAKWRQHYIEKWGRGIEPLLPAIYERQLAIEQGLGTAGRLPSIDFSTKSGWAYGDSPTVEKGSGKTWTADAIRKQIKKDTAAGKKPKVSMADLGKPKAGAGYNNPGLIEQAAGWGSGFNRLGREGDPHGQAFAAGGSLFPTPDQTKAVVPGQTFLDLLNDSTKVGENGLRFQLDPTGQMDNIQAYNQMMRSYFGDDLTDQQLDSLRQMSAESYYRHLVTAASEYEDTPASAVKRAASGGTGGKSKFGVFDTGVRGERVADSTAARLARNVDVEAENQLIDSLQGMTLAQRRAAIEAYDPGLTPPPAGTPTNPTGRVRTPDVRQYKNKPSLNEEGRPFLSNPRGGAIPNLRDLTRIYMRGWNVPVGDGPAALWYDRVVEVVESIVGPGNVEDASMLVDLIGQTSMATAVDRNANLALQAFAENKFGRTTQMIDTLRKNGVEITEEEINKMRSNARARAASYMPAHKEGISKINAEFDRRAATPGSPGRATATGPKTMNYSSSMQFRIWERSLGKLYEDNPALRDQVVGALRKASAAYTNDRHDARIWNMNTNVEPSEFIAARAAGLQAARTLGITGEEAQAAGWYYSKGAQGFIPVARNDDLAAAIREAWNKNIDKVGGAQVIRDAVVRAMPEATEGEIEETARDWMAQEVMRAFLNSETGVGAARVLKEQTDWFHNNAKVTTDRFFRDVLPNLGDGGTMDRDGNLLQIGKGYSVALGGIVLDPTAKNAKLKFKEFLSNMDPALGNDPELKIGLYRFGTGSDVPKKKRGKVALDVTAIIDDLETARTLGAAANQYSIWDNAAFDEIKVGGSGDSPFTTAQEILAAFRGTKKGVAEETLGVASVGPDMAMLLAAATGVPVNNVRAAGTAMGIYRMRVQDQVVEPLLRRYKASGAARFAQGVRDQDPRIPPTLRDEDVAAVNFAEVGQDPLLSTEANQVLTRRLADGRTWGDAVDDYAEEARADMAVLQGEGVSWGDFASLEQKLASAKSDEARSIIRKYDKLRVDPLSGDPEAIAQARIGRQVAEERGVKFDASSPYDTFKAAWGEQALLSPKYHTGNILGGYISNSLGGVVGATPVDFLRAYRMVRGGLDEAEQQGFTAPASLKGNEVAKKFGLDALPPGVVRGGVRALTGQEARSSATGRIVGKASRPLANVADRVMRFNSDLAQAEDIVFRSALWSTVMDNHMSNIIPQIDAEIAAMGQKQGVDMAGYTVGDLADLAPATVRNDLIERGFNQGFAERAARNVAEARKQGLNKAQAEVNKRHFSYQKTNLDEMVGKIVPFHYWASRALRYFGEESVRHPQLILNYMRMNEGIEKAQEDPGLSARQKGFLRLMGSPTGFTMLMNPDALIGVVKVFGVDTSYTPEGETEAGGIIRWMKERGIGLYPWIDGAINMAGVYGDTFDPDLLGIRHKALIGSAINFMRSELGMEPAGAPYADAMAGARQAVSTFVSSFTPDWLTAPVAQKASGSFQSNMLDTVIENRILAENPNITNGELLQIMSDPDSPEYQSAYQDASRAGVIQQLLNFTLPANFRVRENSRDVRRAVLDQHYGKAEELGIRPEDVDPIADAQFAATYLAQTGKQWEPGQFEKARFQDELSRATPEARPFIVQEWEYRHLGTPQDQKVWDQYSAIRNGYAPETMNIPDFTTRNELANQWADRTGNAAVVRGMKALQDAYVTTHPDLGQFKGWQDRMFDLKNNLGGSLQQYRTQAAQNNPNAARYFLDRLNYVRENFPIEEWEGMMDYYTTSPEAWFTITGRAMMRNDPAPLPGPSTYDPAAGMLPPDQGGYGYDPRPQGVGPNENWTQAMQRAMAGGGMNQPGTFWNT